VCFQGKNFRSKDSARRRKKIENGMRNKYKELEDEFQKLKAEANFAREDLERIRSSAQATRSKSENVGAANSSMKNENKKI